MVARFNYQYRALGAVTRQARGESAARHDDRVSAISSAATVSSGVQLR
jgi:hypothetical protein